MKVSVIISNYNYAQYLPAAIESVLAQTYPDPEIVVVDDGSTDNSRQVITQFYEKYPNQIKPVFQANQGQGGAFNSGFEVSTGEIIAFLDADDIWKPNKLQRVLEEFRQPEIVGIMHPLDIIDGNGNVTQQSSTQNTGLIEDLARVIVETGNAWWFPPTSGLAYRRSALANVLPMDAVKWRLCADDCLIFCTAFFGKIKTLKEVLGYYRIHGANYYSNQERKAPEAAAKSTAKVEMTNQYLNEFLERIGYPERVDLSRNLQYRRKQYDLKKKWDSDEVLAISGLILGWPFYTWQKRVYYLARFWLKSMRFLLNL